MTNSRLAIACVAAISFTFALSARGVLRNVEAGIGAYASERTDATLATVNVTASACEPNGLDLRAGPVTFLVRNASSRALEWEILDGVMVIAERENIPAGSVRNLTVKLAPGDYQITCGLLSNPKGSLHVAGLDGASAMPSQAELIGPLAEYRVYASLEIDGLVDDTQRLADALKAGDLKAARAAYWSTHAHYARIAPIALFFPDLDGYVDLSAGDHKAALLGAAGYRQLEWALFGKVEPRDYRALADTLVDNVVAMQTRFETLSLTPAPTIAGAVEVIGGVAQDALGSEQGRSAALSDVQAHIEGVRKIIDLFRPLLVKADGQLIQTLDVDLAALDSTLAKYKNADGGIETTASLRSNDRTVMLTIMKKLSAELSKIPAALGFG